MSIKTTVYWVGLSVLVWVAGFVSGAEYGMPVYNITDIVWLTPNHGMTPILGSYCHFKYGEKP